MRRTLALNKLDLSSVAADSVVLIIGRRATGKSVLAMDVLRAAGFADKEAMKGNETRGLIFSPTEKTTPLYGPAFADAPGVHIVDEYSPTSLAAACRWKVRKGALVVTACGCVALVEDELY